jgi:hypothetical protein
MTTFSFNFYSSAINAQSIKHKIIASTFDFLEIQYKINEVNMIAVNVMNIFLSIISFSNHFIFNDNEIYDV